ncbi:MAG: hypothetical protein ACI8P9_004966 [Parasphingorhabdus sp.]|jgi:hypothetical protein
MNDYFSAMYSDARANFLSACIDNELPVQSFQNPLRGPSGESLYTDVTRIGSKTASRVVVVTSSTHGVEGFAGSAIQVGLIKDTNAPRPTHDVALLLVHAINPHGFAWLRRENEDNVDLNRNFVDHENQNYPENDLFEEIVDNLVPRQWDDDAYAKYKQAILMLNQKYGEVTVRKAMHKGQYKHPDSIHYGGSTATWSNKTLLSICENYLSSSQTAVMIDVHTGLGPYGYGELMTPSKPGERVFDLFSAWYGSDVHSTTAGESLYAGSKGSILYGFQPLAGSLEWAAIGLEFGTRERERMRKAMLANSWLHLHGTLDSDLGRQIKQEVRNASYPDEDEWKSLVWQRGKEVVSIALDNI